MASDAQPISATPAVKQIIEHNGVRYTTIKEGLAHILVPEATVEENAKLRNDQAVHQVFYNPIQQFNRDLTVLAIKAYGKEKVEQKHLANLAKSSKFDKKRKRKGQHGEAGEPPTKSPRLDEAALEATHGTTQAEADLQLQGEAGCAPETAPASGNTEATQDSTLTSSESKPSNPPSFTVLDALSASGLRALRYAHEIPFLTSVTSNDLLKSAVESIKLNVQHNNLESKIKVSHDDAIAHMYTLVAQELRRRDARGKPVKSEKYDVVDLDPYGTAAPFLDAAVQAVRDDGGLLCVTCTDSGVWASNGYPEKCYALYGGVPVKGWYSHEAGLRIVLHAIETSAAKYGLAMEPLLSLSIDFYVRIFVRIRKSPAMVKFQGGKNMVVYNCDSGCGAWTTQLLMRNKAAENKKGSGIFYKHTSALGPTGEKSCEHCGSSMHMAGPMYAGYIHSPAFVKSVLAELDGSPKEVYGTTDRIRGMLQTALEENLPARKEGHTEAKADVDAAAAQDTEDKKPVSREEELAAIDPYPFYFHPGQLSGIIRCSTPPEAPLKGALKGLGYRVTRSHCKPGSIKTDAPWSIIWQVMKEWVRQKAPIKEENVKVGSTGYRLLGLGKQTQEMGADQGKQDEKPAVVFDEELGRDPSSASQGKLVRYQMNPRENWGPMNRAKGR